MRVLILGGTGFTGPHVVRRLCALGHDVAVFHRGRHEPELPPEVVHIHDPAIAFGERRLTHHRDAFERFAPDLVLDTLAMNEADARATVDSFGHLVSRMVVLSSQDVYRTYGRLHRTEPGLPVPVPVVEDGPLRERLYPHRAEPLRPSDDPRRGLDFYDKLVVEQVFTGQPGFKTTVLRLAAVYGPGDEQHRLVQPQPGRPYSADRPPEGLGPSSERACRGASPTDADSEWTCGRGTVWPKPLVAWSRQIGILRPFTPGSPPGSTETGWLPSQTSSALCRNASPRWCVYRQ